MKISLNWLKEFIPIKMSPHELAEKISMSVVEVEEIVDFEKLFKGVLVGEIKEIKKHPKTDRLSVAKVLVGKKTIQIIFGSLKLKVGDKLPIVVAPATLPTGLKVEKKILRGVESQGMIASTKEMGLDFEEEVIFFGSSPLTGIPVAKALGLDDVVLNLDVLSNRPDLFSHLGVARELGAIFKRKIKKPQIRLSEAKDKKIEKYLDVEIKDKNLCPRYEARVITDVDVKGSPQWLKNRLTVLGIRPINNVVDITNYVMMELGQPLHAFDFDKINGMSSKKKIIIRRAKPGEGILTLDDKERKLTKDILVIADSKKPIAVAGVMGGKGSEVDEGTKTVILESANFNWVSIRKASRILGLRTEAVNRFEKNLSPDMTQDALDRAAELITDLAKGKIMKGVVDKNYSKVSSKTIELRIPRLNKYLGQNIKEETVKRTLTSLGMEVLLKNKKTQVKIPTFRSDIKEEVDLIEEVARISGYDKIPTTSPVEELVPPSKNKEVETEERIKDILKGLGVTEVSNYTFVGDDLLQKFGLTSKSFYKLENPLNPEHVYLRQSLVPSMVKTADFNARNFDEFSIFEIARIFKNRGSKYPQEERRLSVIGLFKKDSFFKLKGILEGLFRELGIKNISFSPYGGSAAGRKHSKNGEEYWHPQRTASILSDDAKIGVMGELHPEVAGRFDFKSRVVVGEIDFDELLKKQEIKIFKQFSRYPKVVLDLAVTLDEKIEEARIRDEINKVGKGLVSEVELFDIYRGHQIEIGKKSLAYHVTYQSASRTLNEEEVNTVHQKIISSLSRKFKAKVRS